MTAQAAFLQKWHRRATRSYHRLRAAMRKNENKDKITEGLVATRAIRRDLDELTKHLKDLVRRTPEAMGSALEHTEQILNSSRNFVPHVIKVEMLLSALNQQQNQPDGRGHRKTAGQWLSEIDKLVPRVAEIENQLEGLLDNVEDLTNDLRRGNNSATPVRRVEVRAKIQRYHQRSDQDFLDDEVS